MRKSTVEAVVTGVLVVVLVVLVLMKLGGKESGPDKPTLRTADPPPELLARIEYLKGKATQFLAKPDGQADPEVKEEQKQRASLPWGRDPFSSGEGEEPEQDALNPSLMCRGIFSMDDERLALLGYAIVREGETIEGYLVERIGRDRVVLGKGKNTYVLRVGEE